MKHLADYMYNEVEIITDDDQKFIGTVESWESAVTNKEENDRDEISIDVRKDDSSVTLYESEIKSIKEL